MINGVDVKQFLCQEAELDSMFTLADMGDKKVWVVKLGHEKIWEAYAQDGKPRPGAKLHYWEMPTTKFTRTGEIVWSRKGLAVVIDGEIKAAVEDYDGWILD